MSALIRPSGQPIDFSKISNEVVTEEVKQAVSDIADIRASILDSPPNHKRARLYGMDQLLDRLYSVMSPLELLQETVPELSQACQDGSLILRKKIDEIFLDADIYHALIEFRSAFVTMTGPEMILLEDLLFAFERNGLQLPPKKKKKFVALCDLLNEKEIQFHDHISKDEATISFSLAELHGLPESILEAHRQEDQFSFPLIAPSIGPILKFAHEEETRKLAFMAYLNKVADQNVSLLEEILDLREQKAKLLGYESFAHYEMADKMAKTPETVEKLYQAIAPKALEKAQFDLELLLKNNPNCAAEAWNRAYLSNRVKEIQFKVNTEEIKAYFPLERVLDEVFRLSEMMFDFSVQEDKVSGWHKDVKVYLVQRQGQQIGRFYLDLFPRKGKFSHAACFDITSGKELERSYRKPEAALVCNFLPGSKGRPCLLTHDEVETVFHEFGHLWHQILTQSPLATLAGTRVMHDFVETPSQFFEQFAWRQETLKSMSSHYQTGEALPEKLIKRLLALRDFNSGIHLQQQIFYGSLDMAFHSREKKNRKHTTACVARLQNELTLFPYVEGTHFQAAFGHLVGYAAGYYGYIYSQIFSDDLFQFVENHLDKSGGFSLQDIGKLFRRHLFEPGGGEDPHLMLKRILGRPASEKAFLDRLNIQS